MHDEGDIRQRFQWNVPRLPTARYLDAPPNQTADDPFLQFWDGLRFCEIEYHTRGISVDQPEVVDASKLVSIEQPCGNVTPLEFLKKKYDAT